MDLVLVAAILMTLAFALTNGLHDAANAVATLVATGAAKPLPAIVLASLMNLLGPLVFGAAVADTIAGLVLVEPTILVPVVGAGASGALVWNLFTWSRGMPSSSSHALVGGLVGAAVAAAGSGAVEWGPVVDGQLGGVLGILLGIGLAAGLGFGVSWVLERGALRIARRATAKAGRPVRTAQWLTSGWLAFSQGANNAQKVVGIIAAMLAATGYASSSSQTGWGVVGLCSLALTLGTALGGWRIVKTIGTRIYQLHSIDGLVSQTSSAGVIFASSIAGLPVSASQVVASSVVGIGAGRRRWKHISWDIVREMGIAWLTTMPAAAIIAIASLPLWRAIAGA